MIKLSYKSVSISIRLILCIKILLVYFAVRIVALIITHICTFSFINCRFVDLFIFQDNEDHVSLVL